MGRLQLKPSEAVQLAGNPETQKDLSKQVKIVFAQLAQRYSYSARNIMFASFKNFLALNEIELPLVGFKIKLERKVKPLFTWEDAERTISKASIEYQPIYRFMLWSAFDIERFVQINRDQERLPNIKRQLDDERKEWIRIDVPKGRKSSPPFYALVPREIAKLLPVLDQQGKPITSKNSIHYHWQNALRRAGFNFVHFGPHNLRSAWTGEATRRKLEPVVREHQMGHMVDGENYQRMQQDEAWVTEQFRRAWETQQVATIGEVETLREQVDRLQKVEEARKPADELMSTLLEDEEVQAFLKRKLGRTRAKTYVIETDN